MNYAITSPEGARIEIPFSSADDSHRFTIDQMEEAKKFYEEEGYVVIRGLIPTQSTENAYRAFKKEIRPYSGFLYRQATANPERHVLTRAGHMLNSILNLQDLRQKLFPEFRSQAISILTHERMQSALNCIFGEAPTLVQSMFFEGNPATWAHQDSYYLDSSKIGMMIGAWIAVEDIHPGAGRFFVYPKSHKLVVPQHDENINIVDKHRNYKDLIIDEIKKHNLKCVAPAVSAGDVVFWGALTIHGSLNTTEAEFSRASFTGHYIPESTQFLQYQKHIKKTYLEKVNGMLVNFPKDQNRLKNRLILFVETSFPKAFQSLKQMAIRRLVRTRATAA